VDVARLKTAKNRDPLALRALAQGAQSHGNFGEADAYYQVLLKEQPRDSVISNNAAGVRLELGHMQAALDLYADSIAKKETALALFNLSQAYGRAFQVEDLSRTLARAQQLDGETVARLAQLHGTEAEGFVVALPLGLDYLRRRVLSSGGGEPIAAELRSFFAPGVLGTTVEWAALAFGLAALVGSLAGWRYKASSLCPRCGTRICPRCDNEEQETSRETCTDCVRLFRQTENTDRVLRIERINALRKREQRLDKATWIASIFIPGAAGALAGKPVQSVVGALCFGLVLASVYWKDGVVPDPLVAGASAPLVFLGVAVLAALGYALAVAISLPSRRDA
jgi:tetratricopeptide (TPR) repeat protein